MSDLLTPETIISGLNADYQIVNLIGRGGMGAVYRARRTADNTIWALKEMRPIDESAGAELEENRKLFLQEAELLRNLSHPSLPIVADLFEYQNRPVMVMEFVAGQTLEDRLRDANAPMLEQQALGFGIQVARVLHYLHTRKPPIIYRDLKPSNVMLTPEGVLKLIDFGVARTYKERKKKDTVAMGSAGYAPPEQYGKGQTDARSDVYALGATLLHLLTNLPPIPLQTPAPGSIRKLNPSVDPQTEKVIIRAMDLDPSRRFTSAAELEQAITKCLDAPFADPILRAPPPPPVLPPKPAPAVAPVAAPPRQAPAVAATAPVNSGPPRQAPAQQQQPPPVRPAVASGPPCPRCGRVNKASARFCAGCGNPLTATPPSARLRITSPRASWEQRLDAGPVRIGRRDPRQNLYPELDLAEHDRGIASRNHAVIQRDGDSYTITDLGSTNGTTLNGTLLNRHQAQRLRPGDKIKIGEVEIEFHWS
jgi:serine/threonine protein kinase